MPLGRPTALAAADYRGAASFLSFAAIAVRVLEARRVADCKMTDLAALLPWN